MSRGCRLARNSTGASLKGPMSPFPFRGCPLFNTPSGSLWRGQRIFQATTQASFKALRPKTSCRIPEQQCIRCALEVEGEAESATRCRMGDKPALADIFIRRRAPLPLAPRTQRDARARGHTSVRSRSRDTSASGSHRGRRPSDIPRPKSQASTLAAGFWQNAGHT
jgi:hypothetical protein